MGKKNVITMGAAGRDFHNYLMFFKHNSAYNVVCFTAAQIPNIINRKLPASLAGRRYPKGIPIKDEKDLPALVKKHKVDVVVFAYSDLSHEEVMHKASIAMAAGADFWLLGPDSTQVKVKVPVVAVAATRTGAGKTTVSRTLCELLRKQGKKVVAVRHPMPYGDLAKQAVQRFSSYADLDKHKCSIEEREEYEEYVSRGFVIYSGVDYQRIFAKAAKEAEVIVYEGGNNDFPLVKPNLLITVADPHRPGHGLSSFPGEVNVRMADVVLVNKVNTASRKNVKLVEMLMRSVNKGVSIIEASSLLPVDKPKLVKGKKVLVVEDGPTVTHGGLKGAAGYYAAKKYGAKIVTPDRAVGSIKKAIEKYELSVIPALGYGKKQIDELCKSINHTNCDTVLLGTPADLRRFMKINKPVARVRYELDGAAKRKLASLVRKL